MPRRKTHLDDLLREWPYEFGEVIARWAHGSDGRPVVQLRVDLGVLQMEVDDRPDGSRPQGASSLLEWVRQRGDEASGDRMLSADECAEVDREFVQYYHRRVAWLALREFRRAKDDADHTLALMDSTVEASPSDDWVEAHERYRPFVLFHRTQAAALAELEDGQPDDAVRELDTGLGRIVEALSEGVPGADDRFGHDEPPLGAGDEAYGVADENDFVDKLSALRESIVEEYGLEPSLEQRLSEAIANEQYELAAELRDLISGQRHQ